MFNYFFLFFAPFFESVTICYGLIWWSICLFSIYICNVFNLMIIVLYIDEKFSFCVFWVVVIYRVVFCQDVKCTPLYGYFSVVYLFMLLMIHSLFDVRVDMISANFALWNNWSVIEVRLKQDWDKNWLNYVFSNIA